MLWNCTAKRSNVMSIAVAESLTDDALLGTDIPSFLSIFQTESDKYKQQLRQWSHASRHVTGIISIVRNSVPQGRHCQI